MSGIAYVHKICEDGEKASVDLSKLTRHVFAHLRWPYLVSFPLRIHGTRTHICLACRV